MYFPLYTIVLYLTWHVEAGVPGATYDYTESLRAQCGRLTHNNRMRLCAFDPRTSGTTRILQWPWIAKLHVKNLQGSIVKECVGVLISDHYVLTVAHCCRVQLDISPIEVILGNYVERFFLNSIPRVFAKVMKIVHYDNSSRIHDVVLLKLDRNLTFDDFVRPICLPPHPPTLQSLNLPSAYGFATWPHGIFSNELMIVPSLLNSTACVEKLKKSRIPFQITPNMICSQLRNGLKSPYIDAVNHGGAIMNKVEERWYLYGLNSMIIVSNSFLDDDYLIIAMEIENHYAAWMRRITMA